MPLKLNKAKGEAFKRKVEALKQGIIDAMPLAGRIVADAIVRTTLQGTGAGDTPFAPYSESYQKLIDAVGGKPGGVVNLRGVFIKEGYKGATREFKFLTGNETKRGRAKFLKTEGARQVRALARGSGRRAYVQVSIAGRSFFAMTKPTRNAKGIIDPQSEMSADLIKVVAHDAGFRLEYHPRLDDYMITNNVTRPWFSTDKTAIRAEMADFLKTVFRALVRNFNA